MATTTGSKKLHILLIPFFATSHIGPFSDLAISLVTASADAAVEATVAVTPANLPILESFLQRHAGTAGRVKTTTYPFPDMEGLPKGVENMGKVAAGEAWRIDVAAMSEHLMRPAHEALIRAQSPDAVVTDLHFVWNGVIAKELGVPCVQFAVVGAFSTVAMRHLALMGAVESDVIPGIPGPDIRVPRTELPEFLRTRMFADGSSFKSFYTAQADCFGYAVNTFSSLEEPYCDMHVRHGYVKRAYFLGPISLRPSRDAGDSSATNQCVDWLDAKPSRSVVYLCFGSLAPVSDAQLHELALGLEASGKSFVWVVRAEKWTPPEGWEERVGERGMVVTSWAPQAAILRHPAVGVFVTHCGWNSVLETVSAGVPVLTWPMVFEQFITERLLAEVLGIGNRLWPHGAGLRSESYQQHELVPAEDVARALTTFMSPGGPGDLARCRVIDLAAKAQAAVAPGGSSSRDVHRLLHDFMAAKKTT